MTTLSIIETQLGDVLAYISMNVISIIDGQKLLSFDLFNIGIKSVFNVGIFISRVWFMTQIKAMKQVAGESRLELILFIYIIWKFFRTHYYHFIL